MDKRKLPKSEEHKEKIRQALLGRKRPKGVIEKMSNSAKGKSTWSKGLKMSDEFKKKRSEINKRDKVIPPSRKGVKLTEEHKKKLKGRKPWNYIEDRSKISGGLFRKDSKEYRTWSKLVKERDEYKCQLYSDECEGQLESHHILNWIDHPTERFNISNGITLCQKHHPLGRYMENMTIVVFNRIVSSKLSR